MSEFEQDRNGSLRSGAELGKKLDSLSLSGAQRQDSRGTRFRRSAVSVAVLLILSLLGYWGFGDTPGPGNKAEASQSQPIPDGGKTIQPPAPRTEVVSKLEAQGFVTATRVATVSSRVMGVVRDVLVEEGDRVVSGQTLARLDDRQAQLALGLAASSLEAIQARIKTAEVDLKEKNLDFQRETNLLDKGFVSEITVNKTRNQVERYEASLEQLQADLQVARLQVRQQETQLDDHVIKAPFAGIVVDTSAQAGEVIAPSAAGGGFTRTGICTIVDMSSLEVMVEINEQMISQIEGGQPVQIQPLAYRDILLAGQVDKILPRVNLAKGTVEVRIRMHDLDPRILPDMGVRVAFL
ncbi:efflux RND transporter periplasmic adaptor subunit [Bowmanella dokdonensis]|uniref:Efflux RND transporter periplasmic adaptor subunit n=1 Tax=Bowmanella dokdonensis TaxID=751969 RepID=A0A939DK34_9ALTE|nr:efflux RND transporter periplasmic adaptor subunit [Bowmanella dokdonensis]MBN7823943.1 efflux RND transporter periplasmic adaptor subunit [Bowmanella dokdonensis]